MSCNYTLELQDVRGIPNSCSWLVLEVIIHTQRLLSTIRRKHATAPFQVQNVHGVTVQWSQTTAAKAFIRLRLLPGPGADTAMDEGGAIDANATRAGCKSEAVTLQLVRKQEPQVAQLQLSLPLSPPLLDGHGPQGCGDGGAPGSVLAEVDVLLRTTPTTNGATTAGIAAAATAAHSSAVVGAAAQQAWVEPAAPARLPLNSGVPSVAAGPRKRSWLLALGLGRHGNGAGAAIDTTTTAVPIDGETNGVSGAAGPTCERVSAGAAMEPSGRSHGSHAQTKHWESLALATPAATPSGTPPQLLPVPALLVASPRGGCQDQDLDQGPDRIDCRGRAGAGKLSLPSAISSEAATASRPCLAGPDAKPTEPASPSLRPTLLPVEVPLPPAAGGVPAEATPSAAAAGLAPAASGCTESQPKPPKRRRLGDFLARLFSTSSSSSGVQARRTTAAAVADAASAASACPVAAAQASAAMDVVAASRASSPTLQSSSPPAGAAGVSGRRLGAPTNMTPLLPPSPRLGDVYRLQDNAMASDVGVQLGFGAAAALGAADGRPPNSGPLPLPLPLPGLDSPGYGEASPAGGPDRLTIEPPVDDMAAASLATPMATSPGTPAGGCFFWRYGAAARARAAAAQVVAAAAAARSDAAGPSAAAPGAALAQAQGGDSEAVGGSATSPPPPPAGPADATGPGAAGGWGASRSGLRTLGLGLGCDAVPQAAPYGAQAPVGSSPGCATMATATGQPPVPPEQQQQQQPRRRRFSAEVQDHGESRGAAAAAVRASSSPLEAEINRVVAFISGQSEIEEDLRATSLSQCQFLLDCLTNPEMCWIVPDSLLQLKHEVGFPFDSGVPIPGAPDWFRLVLQPLEPLLQPTGFVSEPPQEKTAATAAATTAAATTAVGSCVGWSDAEGGVMTAVSIVPTAAAVAAAAAAPPPPRSPEVLKVRWARLDQRQVGGGNACAAIVLEVAAWCLGAVQRCRNSVGGGSGGGGGGGRNDFLGRGKDGASAATIWPQPSPWEHGGNRSSGGGSGSSRREVTPLMSRSQRERLAAAAVELEALTGLALEQCIQAGTEVWQSVLVQSPAARVASRTGDFDLEHMLQLGGYSQRLRLADYTAASLLQCAASGGGKACTTELGQARRASREWRSSGGGDGGGAEQQEQPRGWHGSPQKKAAERQSDFSPSGPRHPQEPSSPPEGRQGAHPRPPRPPLTVQVGSDPCTTAAAAARRPSQCGVPGFASVVRGLTQGVYVLGWHGHFATLWIRPGGIVHLIDSLGARLAADCPLAFVLEFDAVADFLDFFLPRHKAPRDAAATDDIAGANLAALVEVHRLELVQPSAAAAGVGGGTR